MRNEAPIKWLGRIVVANWLLWFVITIAIGGDAPSGQIVDGHYFVSSHAKLTEVSRHLFEFSMWYTYVTWISVLLAALAGLWIGRRRTSQK